MLTDPKELMAFAAVTLFAGFIPMLAGLSVYLRSNRAGTRLNAAVALYGLENDRYYQIYLQTKLPPLWKQTWFPILVIFLMGLYFSFLMVYTGRAIGTESFPSTLLILGPEWQPSALKEGAEAYRLGTFTAISFAYLGWYVWSIATIFSRLATLELVAATYMNMLIRLVMAVLLAIVFRHLASSLFSATLFPPAVIGFGVGIFPDTALTWISRELRNRLLGQADADNELPLDLILGVSPYRKLRLYEMGIDNCQNLAASNPIQLFMTSNLSLLEVLDWINQAQLVVLVGANNFLKLQSNGWQLARDFARACGSPAKPVVATLIGYDERQLDDLRTGLLENPKFTRLENLQERIRQADRLDEAALNLPVLTPAAIMKARC